MRVRSDGLPGLLYGAGVPGRRGRCVLRYIQEGTMEELRIFLHQWQPLFEIVLAVAAVGALIAALISARAARASAEMARRTQQLARRQYRQSITPSLRAELEEFGQANEWLTGVRLRNSGKGTAVEVEVELTALRKSRGPKQTPEREESKSRLRNLSPGDVEPVEPLHARNMFYVYSDVWGTIRCKDVEGNEYVSRRVQGQPEWEVEAVSESES